MSASMSGYEKLVQLINLASDGLGDDIKLIRSEVAASTVFESMGHEAPATVLEVTVRPDAPLDEWGVPEHEFFENVTVEMCYRSMGDAEGGIDLLIDVPTRFDQSLSEENEATLTSFLGMAYGSIVSSAA